MPKPMAVYTAAFLTADAKRQLQEWFAANVGPVHDKVFCHHMTIQFKPSDDEVRALTLGDLRVLKVVGFVNTDTVQAVEVAGMSRADGGIAHVTVACGEGGKPFHSNAALAEGRRPIDGPALMARVGFLSRRQVETFEVA
jgi:hypothetical protein